MFLTEKYEIFISFLGRSLPEREYIVEVWNQAIYEEYQKSSIYINVTIDESSLACVGCTKGEKGFVITAIRNPIQTPDQELYYYSLGRVLFNVRKTLGSPYTLVINEDTKISYFPYDPKAGR